MTQVTVIRLLNWTLLMVKWVNLLKVKYWIGIVCQRRCAILPALRSLKTITNRVVGLFFNLNGNYLVKWSLIAELDHSFFFLQHVLSPSGTLFALPCFIFRLTIWTHKFATDRLPFTISSDKLDWLNSNSLFIVWFSLMHKYNTWNRMYAEHLRILIKLYGILSEMIFYLLCIKTWYW